MLIRLTSLLDFSLKTPDLELGQADDFYLDDMTWEVPYAKTKELPWFRHERLLLSLQGLAALDLEERVIRFSASRDDIADGPTAEEMKPLAERKKEGIEAASRSMSEYEKFLQTQRPKTPGAERLRSCRELFFYRLHAKGEDAGLVQDIVVDENWLLHYWLVETRWPGGKSLVPISKTTQLSWEDRAIYVGVRAETVKGSPRLAGEGLVEEEDERLVTEYYRRLDLAA